MGKGGARMSPGYEIEIQRPLRSRRGDSKLIVVVKDSQGKEIYRDRADLNAEKARNRIAERIAHLTGDSPDNIVDRLLDKLSQLPPPASTASAPLGGQTTSYPYEATPGGLLWNKETAEGIIPTSLTTFTALIAGQVVEDDGAEVRRLLEIEATFLAQTNQWRYEFLRFSPSDRPSCCRLSFPVVRSQGLLYLSCRGPAIHLRQRVDGCLLHTGIIVLHEFGEFWNSFFDSQLSDCLCDCCYNNGDRVIQESQQCAIVVARIPDRSKPPECFGDSL